MEDLEMSTLMLSTKLAKELARMETALYRLGMRREDIAEYLKTELAKAQQKAEARFGAPRAK